MYHLGSFIRGAGLFRLIKAKVSRDPAFCSLHGARRALSTSQPLLTSAARKATARAKGKEKHPATRGPKPSPLRVRSRHRERGQDVDAAARRFSPPEHSRLESERDVRRELSQLRSELARVEKREASASTEAQLPPLDDAALQTFYEALKLPDPPTDEEVRLRVREARRRAVKLLEDGQRKQARIESRREAGQDITASGASAALTVMRRPNNLSPMLRSRDEEHADALAKLASRLSLRTAQQGESAPSSPGEMVALLDQAVVAARERVQEADKGHGAAPGDSAPLPTGLATRTEWLALAQACAAARDEQALLRLASLCRLERGRVTQLQVLDEAMDHLASQGDVEGCQRLVAHMSKADLQPSLHTHHSLAKANLRAGDLAGAVALLSELEDSPRPASLATYTMVLYHVLQHPRREARAQLWPLFYRMRMVAHPTPDAPLYALMIRACARGVVPDEAQSRSGGEQSDVERALDLFREMTTRYGVRPTSEVYNALILACARRRDTYAEAFRLLREMVQLERSRLAWTRDVEARGGVDGGDGGVAEAHDDEQAAALAARDLAAKAPRFAPDRHTFNALLQGCARNGDLMHARWAFAEMLRSSTALWQETMQQVAARDADAEGRGGARDPDPMALLDIEAQRPDAASLAHLFWTYASFRPPLKSSQVRQVSVGAAATTTAVGTEGASPAGEGHVQPAAEADGTANAHARDVERDRQDAQPDGGAEPFSFTSSVPKTSEEVVREAKALLARVEADAPAQDVEDGGGLLSSIRPSVPMLNAYLAVLVAHAPQSTRLADLEQAVFGAADDEVVHPGADADIDANAGREQTLPSVFSRFGLQPNVFSYQTVLQACSRSPDRRRADRLAHRTWLAFQASPDAAELDAMLRGTRSAELASTEAGEASSSARPHAANAAARALQRCWSAMIHSLARSHRLDEAMSTVRDFLERYPPPPRPEATSPPAVASLLDRVNLDVFRTPPRRGGGAMADRAAGPREDAVAREMAGGETVADDDPDGTTVASSAGMPDTRDVEVGTRAEAKAEVGQDEGSSTQSSEHAQEMGHATPETIGPEAVGGPPSAHSTAEAHTEDPASTASVTSPRPAPSSPPSPPPHPAQPCGQVAPAWPRLTFDEVELLHHRLVALCDARFGGGGGAPDDETSEARRARRQLRELTWVAHRYGDSLRVRRPRPDGAAAAAAGGGRPRRPPMSELQRTGQLVRAPRW